MDNMLQTVLYIIATLVVVGADTDILPNFHREPTSQVAHRGSTVKLKCTFEPTDADVRWKFNGQLITSQNSFGVDFSKNNLIVIETFQDSDPFSNVGDYQCVVSTRAGTIVSRIAKLQVPYIKPFNKRLTEEVNAPVAGDAIIPCENPESLPAANMTYTKDGVTIQPSPGHFRVLPSGHLHITNVSLKDAGIYRCYAENPVSNQRVLEETAISFHVEKEMFNSDTSPIILYSNGDRVVRGKDAVLECAAIGKPVPSVRWERIEGTVPSSAYQHGGSLVIPDVSIRDDGTYVCVADNGVGEPTRSQVTLYVIKPPSIKKAPKDAVVEIRDTGKFKCVVGRATEDDISWYFNGRLLVPNDSKYTISGGELIVRDVTIADIGLYQCFVETEEGVNHATAQMKLTDGYPTIITPPENTTAIEGERVFLTCTIAGDPMPYVGWFNPSGEKIFNTPHKFLVSEDLAGRLYITNVNKDDVGWYVCTASNKYGRTQAKAYLEVIPLQDIMTTKVVLDAPENLTQSRVSDGALPGATEIHVTFPKPGSEPLNAPSKPQLRKTSDNSVLVMWNHTVVSSNSPRLARFAVLYKEVRRVGDDWTVASSDISSNARVFEVRNLDEDAIYRFKVVAINENGVRNESEMSNRFLLKIVAPPEKPLYPPVKPTAPRIVNCIPKDHTSVLVQWEFNPTAQEGPVDGFYIFIRLSDSDDDLDYVRTPVRGGDLRQSRITKLEPEESYDIKMSSFKSYPPGSEFVIESVFSNVYIKTLPAEPTDPPPVIIPTPRTPELVVTEAPQSTVNMWHIWLAVVLGVMLFIMLMLIALCMCFWKGNRLQNVKNIRYIPPELHQSVYGSGTYHFVKPDGTMTPYHQVNGYSKHSVSHKQSSSHIAWPKNGHIIEPRPLYTMPQDALNGPVILPYQTFPSSSGHLYTPVTSPNGNISHGGSYEHMNGHPPVMNESVPSLRSISHSSLGPRPVCYIKRCKIPEQIENGDIQVPGNETPSRKGTFSGEESEGGIHSLNPSNPVGSNRSLPRAPSQQATRHDEDRCSECSRPRSLSNTSSHNSNVQSDSSQHSHPTSIHSSSSIITDV